MVRKFQVSVEHKQQWAMGTTQRAGFGRRKHIQIRHLFLQDLRRMKKISLHKVSTKMNPADLGTKKLGAERRKDLGRLIGIFTGEDETSKRAEVMQARRVQMILMTAFQAAAASLLQGFLFLIFILVRQSYNLYYHRSQVSPGIWWRRGDGAFCADSNGAWRRIVIVFRSETFGLSKPKFR